MARPKKFTIRRRKKFIEGIYQGATITSICEALDIDPSTYRHERRNNPDFAAEVDDAKRWRNSIVEDSLYATAVGGNVTAQIFWLCNRDKSNWQNVNKIQASVEADVTQSGTVHHEVVGAVAAATDEIGRMDEDEIVQYANNLSILLAQSATPTIDRSTLEFDDDGDV